MTRLQRLLAPIQPIDLGSEEANEHRRVIEVVSLALLVPAVYAEEFTRRLSGARLETLEGAGHAPHLEEPDTVARVVRDFLTQ